jgi:dUTP pyrophosphatase
MKALQISLCHELAKVPTRGTEGSAGWDLYSTEAAVVQPGQSKLVKTGLKVSIPEGFAGFIWPRSGLALKAALDTGAGLIDSDYRSELGVVLFNHGGMSHVIKPGDRMAQLVIQRYEKDMPLMVVSELGDTDRDGGFGSTGE